jgi:tRNA acetyltransferase TAN1
VVFFKTREPVEPVSFVHKIVQDTADGAQHKNCRFVKRLTPITAIEKANLKGLEAVAKKVLAPHFHGPEQKGKKVSLLPMAPCFQITRNHPWRFTDVLSKL